ncbi:hypothetical protein EFY87_11305 [Flexivirga caeni]|uniref:Uncharacterized protein n=1 Tax=Flexivirga caeni TaxID=2294115 RepID=A0A3M9M705_9MICO|nr:hypothetical protein EFY87_11305 [Flexivirga caeni]
MRAGDTLTAWVVVDNASGHALQFLGCGPPFDLLLGDSNYQQQAVQPLCAEQITIPTGNSSYRTSIMASYSTCSPESDQDTPACGPDGNPPPLPAGHYTVSSVAVSPKLPVPPSVALTVMG